MRNNLGCSNFRLQSEASRLSLSLLLVPYRCDRDTDISLVGPWSTDEEAPVDGSRADLEEDDFLVLGVGDLPLGLQPPNSLPHVLGLQWWHLSPLLTHIQGWRGERQRY